MPTFGPGKLTIKTKAATPVVIDLDCLVNGARIAASPDQGDPTFKLCGTSRPGNRKYTWEFSGNLDIDPEDVDGIFMLSQTAYGTEVDFVFTPNNTAQVTASGTLILDPLDFGADDGDYGEYMTSDFAWPIVNVPVYSPTVPVDDGGAELAEDQPELAAADA